MLHNLIRKFEKKEVSKEEYEFEENNLRKQSKIETQKILQQERKKSKEENIKMVEEKSNVEEKKIGKKVQKNSIASAVGEVLAMKDVKNIDEAAAKVLELRPGKKEKNVKALIKTIIRETNAGKGRWKNYNWNEDNYLLTEK